MDLLNRALEQVIDQLVTQKISNLKLEIENQKQTILGMVLMSGPYNYQNVPYNLMLISIGHVIGCIFNSFAIDLNLCQICHFESKNVKMKSEKNLMIYKDRTDCLWRKYC